MWLVRRLPSLVTSGGRFGGQTGLFGGHRCASFPEPRYLQCSFCWRSRVQVSLKPLSESAGPALDAPLDRDPPLEPPPDRDPPLEPPPDRDPPLEPPPHTPLDALYTPEQSRSILQLLNQASAAELEQVKLLRGRRSVNIVDFRTEHGPFRTLESLVKVPRLKHKSAVVVFDSILNPVKDVKKVKLQLVRFVKPEVDKSWLEDAASIVSLVCGTHRVGWAHLDRTMMVQDWREHECPNFLRGTYLASLYLQDVSEVVSRLPPADFYIIEKSSISSQNSSLIPMMAHMRVVEAILFALLEPKVAGPESNVAPRVLNMTRNVVGRHFSLMVGESRISGGPTLRALMTESRTRASPRIHFTPEMLQEHRTSFRFSSREGGEEMCDAMLQAVAFYELLGGLSS